MDNQMMLAMFTNMINKMSDSELEKTLKQAKSILSPKDYEQLKIIISEKRTKN